MSDDELLEAMCAAMDPIPLGHELERAKAALAMAYPEIQQRTLDEFVTRFLFPCIRCGGEGGTERGRWIKCSTCEGLGKASLRKQHGLTPLVIADAIRGG